MHATRRVMGPAVQKRQKQEKEKKIEVFQEGIVTKLEKNNFLLYLYLYLYPVV